MPLQPVLTPFIGVDRGGHLIAADKEKFSISVYKRAYPVYINPYLRYVAHPAVICVFTSEKTKTQ